MNTTAESREALQNALEGFCDSLPSSIYEESSHVKVLSHIVNYLNWCKAILLYSGWR